MENSQLRAIRSILERCPTDGVTAVTIRQSLANVESHAIALDKIHRDPMLSQMAIDLKAKSAREALSAAVAEARIKASTLLSDYKMNLSINQRQRAGLVPDAYAAETRSVFRRLDAKERAAFMQTAIDSRDSSTLAALLQAPTAVSGLNIEQRDQYLSAYLDAVNPVDSGWIDELEAVATTALNAADSLTAE